KNASSLASSAFEINKRASAAQKEISDSCEKIANLMKNELKGKTPEEKQKFMIEFRKAYNDKIASMSSSEKAEFNDGICKKFVKNDKMLPFKKDGKDMKKNGFGKGKVALPPKDGFCKGEFCKGEVGLPPQPPKPKPEPMKQNGENK
ncbi:MAG: hypothetical protein J6U11_05175, partial [Campylobacter sp.]|nr:hypothetical protein [Campylobacter sp.]